jgi:hypothetical protein
VGLIETTDAYGPVILEEQEEVKDGQPIRVVIRSRPSQADRLIGYIDYVHGVSLSIRLPDAVSGERYRASLEGMPSSRPGETLIVDSLPQGLRFQEHIGQIIGTPTVE